MRAGTLRAKMQTAGGMSRQGSGEEHSGKRGQQGSSWHISEAGLAGAAGTR